MANSKNQMPEEKSTSQKPSGIKKLALDALDRILFIGIGAVGAIATTYITGLLKINPPELKATASYSRIDAGQPVAKDVGGLKLDYTPETARPYGVLRVDIANEGRGSAARVRFQVKISQQLLMSYQEEPDLKVYSSAPVTLTPNEFYTEMAAFPSGAHDHIALRIAGDDRLLNDTRIKLVNDDYEGTVSPIEGISK